MGTWNDWLGVLVGAAIWAGGMLAWAYLRRRRQHAPGLRTLPRAKVFAAHLMMAILGLDFGLMITFGMRLLHGGLLLLLIGVNVCLVAVVWTFHLLSPLGR